MNYFFPSFIFLAVLFSSCESEAEKAHEKAVQDSISAAALKVKYKMMVDSAENVMSKDKDYDMKHAMGMLKVYNEYITKYPDDSMTAEYLFRASDLSFGSRQYTQGINYLEIILDKHKDYPKYMDAVWTAALMYDEHLENVNHGDDRAKQLYEFLIAKYPNSSYAEQAKVLVQYVGKPDSVLVDDVIRKGGK